MGAFCPACCPAGETGDEMLGGRPFSSSLPAIGDAGDVFEDLVCAPRKRHAPDPAASSTSELAASPYITKEMLGPPCSLFRDIHPDWRFELEPGKWRSYPLEESIELDRYWEVYVRMRKGGSRALQKAKLQLMRREGTVNFADLTCQVGGGRPRSLRREEVRSDWLSNTYFFEAFTAALRSAGVSVDSDPEDMFDFRYNQDFRKVSDDGRKLFRGGQPYELPIGWKRFAVNVKGQYDSGDNGWLKEDDSGWAVAYHGTAKDSLPGILCTGFRVGSRQKFEKETGAGVYCTPWINVAQHYSKPQVHRGHTVQMVLQLRVKPSAIRLIADKKATAFEKKYWVVNNPQDIRAYGVLIREQKLQDWVPPEVMVFGKDHPYVKKVLQDLADEVKASERAGGR
mmetsp:Transcript_87220/g.260189  ORF Transcript_87220/g.260189 Transcript_87220/m.260189 type:complete len:397 (+) Transcript_87220:69-1259(+)